jgi:hypothetical protein
MSTQLIERLIGSTPWSAQTALEAGEMVRVGTVTDEDEEIFDVRLSRAVYEDCRGSGAIIRRLAERACAEDGPGHPPCKVRILAEIRRGSGKRGTKAVDVVLVARCRSAWIEVREEGEG